NFPESQSKECVEFVSECVANGWHRKRWHSITTVSECQPMINKSHIICLIDTQHVNGHNTGQPVDTPGGYWGVCVFGGTDPLDDKQYLSAGHVCEPRDMTHPNVTNGSSLEDCHTNFFALADLCGIKWRRLTCESSCSEPLEDPVLSSYSKCLAADQLCVWRRVKSQSDNGLNGGSKFGADNNNQNAFAKELWVFWYGEEPDFNDLVNSELSGTAPHLYHPSPPLLCHRLSH
ncbi:unnamed protein product, partial [Medioppia subpectinata]